MEVEGVRTYYVLRPIRRGMVLDGLGNEAMPFIYIGTALVTGVVVWLYSKFSYLPRKRLIGTIYGIFFVNLVAWWQAFQFDSALTSGLFWIWLDVFSIMGVTVFWMYANDLFDPSSAKRLFGIIASGGGLGAVLGSSLTATLVKPLGATNMLLVAAGIVAMALGIFFLLEKMNYGQPAKRIVAEGDSKRHDVSKFSGVIQTIASSRFLLFLTIVVCLERLTPDLIQYLYHEILTQLATGRDAIAQLDANLERFRAIAEVFAGFFLVSFVLRKFGTTFSLASSAGAILLGLVAFAIFGNPFIILAAFHADEGFRHAWFKAAKELTYTVTSRDVLYSVKPVIEMFFYRLSRGAAGVLIYLIISVLQLGVPGLIVAGVVVSAFWGYSAFVLSAEYRKREKQQEEQEILGAAGTGPAVTKPFLSATAVKH